ncbi:hypothetical protein [uncultured Fenollaria sp.]|uniref:hypothetical protein n=1 Tax=uncultured Fenollaria sp. TaxID=1686315 RepID=UPI0025E249BD|nr:hypothetical protein [uncultured Fenollaria sp.]
MSRAVYSNNIYFLDKEEPHPSSMLKLWMGPGRKFNQIDVHFVASLCKLWHKACIANRTSPNSFSWCMDLRTLVLRTCDDWAMWTDDASLAVSLIKAMFTTLHTFVNSGIRHAYPIELRFACSLGAWT